MGNAKRLRAARERAREQHARLVVERSADPRYVQRRRTEDGYLYSLDADSSAAIEAQLERFRTKFGRDPAPEDPVFFDPNLDEPAPLDEQTMVEAMRAAIIDAGLDPAYADAYEQLGIPRDRREPAPVLCARGRSLARSDGGAAASTGQASTETCDCPSGPRPRHPRPLPRFPSETPASWHQRPQRANGLNWHPTAAAPTWPHPPRTHNWKRRRCCQLSRSNSRAIRSRRSAYSGGVSSNSSRSTVRPGSSEGVSRKSVTTGSRSQILMAATSMVPR